MTTGHRPSRDALLESAVSTLLLGSRQEIPSPSQSREAVRIEDQNLPLCGSDDAFHSEITKRPRQHLADGTDFHRQVRLRRTNYKAPAFGVVLRSVEEMARDAAAQISESLGCNPVVGVLNDTAQLRRYSESNGHVATYRLIESRRMERSNIAIRDGFEIHSGGIGERKRPITDQLAFASIGDGNLPPADRYDIHAREALPHDADPSGRRCEDRGMGFDMDILRSCEHASSGAGVKHVDPSKSTPHLHALGISSEGLGRHRLFLCGPLPLGSLVVSILASPTHGRRGESRSYEGCGDDRPNLAD
jgi:hypothetical protein